MNPYFDTSHLAGALLLVPVLAWGVMEASHLDNRRGEGECRSAGDHRRPVPDAAPPELHRAPAGHDRDRPGLGHWAGAIGMAVLTLAGILWRIHAEERALLTTVGDPYRAYAARHKRLVPLVW